MLVPSRIIAILGRTPEVMNRVRKGRLREKRTEKKRTSERRTRFVSFFPFYFELIGVWSFILLTFIFFCCCCCCLSIFFFPNISCSMRVCVCLKVFHEGCDAASLFCVFFNSCPPLSHHRFQSIKLEGRKRCFPGFRSNSTSLLYFLLA